MNEAALREHLEGHYYVMLHEPVRRVVDRVEVAEVDMPEMPWPLPREGTPELADVFAAAAAVHGMPEDFATAKSRYSSLAENTNA